MARENGELLYRVVGTIFYVVRIADEPEQEVIEAVDMTERARGCVCAAGAVKRAYLIAKKREIENTYVDGCIPRISVSGGSWLFDLCVRVVNV